jgi:hypothetical protein
MNIDRERRTMSIVRVGSTQQFSDNWDGIFSNGKKKKTTKKKAAKKKPTKKTATKKSPKKKDQ